MSFLSAAPDGADYAKQSADKRQVGAFQQAGAAYSNKRQADRDAYANALANRAANYQGAMNMLGASGGGVPNISGLSRGNNPLTLQGTGIGATAGSNWTGWAAPTAGTINGVPMRHGYTYGIQDYLEGTKQEKLGHTDGSYGGVNYAQSYQMPDPNTRDGTGGSIRTPPPQPMPSAPPSPQKYSNFSFAPRRA